jgi:hypothetical protein
MISPSKEQRLVKFESTKGKDSGEKKREVSTSPGLGDGESG